MDQGYALSAVRVQHQFRFSIRNLRPLRERFLPEQLPFIKGLIEVIAQVGLKRLQEAQFQREMQESNLFNRQVIESAKEGIVVYGKDLRYLVWNPFMEALSGLKASDVLGKHPLEVFPFLKEAGVIERLELALVGVIPDPVEFPFSIPGRSGWTKDTSAPLRNAVGEIIGVIATVQDITERKQEEEALKASEGRLQLAASSANIGIWDWDVGRNELVWDNAMYRHYGIRREDFAGAYQAWARCIHPDDAKMVEEAVQAAVRGEREFALEFRIVWPNGSIRFIQAASVTSRDKNGQALHMIGVNLDITERKRAEEERAKLQSQLNQAQKIESVGRLAGGIAHDFNNMLTAIMGNVALAMQDLPLDSPLRDNLDQIQQCAKRSADLTGQLLAFARKQTIAPKVLDLNATVQRMMKMLSRLIGEDIVLDLRPGLDLWSVKLDPGQVDQMLANLCVNARDAIAGMGKITLETENANLDAAYCAAHPGADPGAYVRLAVSDNGCGMAKDVLEHIFEPFFTTKGVSQGTGLGLATVYGIVRQNGGTIEVYSEPGHGTTFKIYLPRHADKAAQVPAPTAAQPAPKGHETILLVEDEPAILWVGKRVLESLGYTVLAAGTPSAALRLAEEHAGEIQLLMTDVVMPEMNGRDLAKRLLSLYPNLKRLFMSGYTANVIAPHGVLEEGIHFIQKPFMQKVLADKVRAALDE